MAGADKKLNNLSYQVLGVLARQPRSGYDIVKQLEHFRPAKTSQVYPTLAKLEEQGLVASQDVAQTSRPNKRLYTVTEAGQLELIAWVGTEPDAPYNRDDFLTMVYSAWLKSPEDVLEMFEARMEALVSVQSRGMPVNVAIDGPVQSVWEQGKEMYYARTGQLELSCANCHEDSYGKMIRADHLSQGHINGFPTYRLKNAKLNNVQARFKGCVRDTRAETYKPGSPEFIALELYVASRGNGLSVEGPSVRN